MKPRSHRKPRPIPEVLTGEEQSRLLGQLEPTDCPSKLRNLALLRIMLNTGVRASEVRDLLLRNLDWRSGRLKVKGKGGKERVVWLSRDDLILLQDWLDFKKRNPSSNGLLFTSLDGSKPICGRWLRKLVARLGDQAGITKDIHPHTLRHTFATDLLRGTKNLRLVQKALGHQDITTTTIYTHIVDEELENAMKTFRNGG